MANRYGIGSAREAEAYLAHPTLAQRLRECVAAMNALDGGSAADVLGQIDAARFRSCLTLFQHVAPTDHGFSMAMDKFYAGVPDAKTLALLDALQQNN